VNGNTIAATATDPQKDIQYLAQEACMYDLIGDIHGHAER
jgi:hypothetical protein